MAQGLGIAGKVEINSRKRGQQSEKGGAKAESEKGRPGLLGLYPVICVGKIEQGHHNGAKGKNIQNIFRNKGLAVKLQGVAYKQPEQRPNHRQHIKSGRGTLTLYESVPLIKHGRRRKCAENTEQVNYRLVFGLAVEGDVIYNIGVYLDTYVGQKTNPGQYGANSKGQAFYGRGVKLLSVL